MNLEHQRLAISIIAAVGTVVQFLSGVLVCKQYVVNKTTAEASSLPFVVGILCCSLWLLYGLVKEDITIIVVNSIGIFLMTLYTLVYYIYSFKKSTVLKQLLCVVVTVIILLLYMSTEDNIDDLLLIFSHLASALTLLTIVAPMSKLMYVLRVKNTECLPFPMILMSFFVSALWYIYGCIIDDNVVQDTNFYGAILAGCQLLLFLKYPNKPKANSLSNSKYIDGI